MVHENKVQHPSNYISKNNITCREKIKKIQSKSRPYAVTGLSISIKISIQLDKYWTGF